MTDQIELSTLESHLWEAANILRGPVDAADFKTYVFPLLFFKRISDVYDEEYAVALKESGGDEEYASFPQNYRFQILNGCHWSEVRAVTSNVGTALQNPSAFSRFIDRLFVHDWDVYAKPPFGGPDQVLNYPTRYTHRVATSNNRLLELRDGQV